MNTRIRYFCFRIYLSASDGDSVQSSPQHAPTMSPTLIGSKAFSDILKVLEEERIDMEKRLESSVQVKSCCILSLLLKITQVSMQYNVVHFPNCFLETYN